MKSALSISTESNLVFSRLAYTATSREVVVCAWIANRQTNPRIDAKNRNRSFRNTVALFVQDNWPSFKLRILTAIYVYKYKRHIKVISFITSLNFIRLLRVVITPSGENDSKQSDEFQATLSHVFALH